MLNLFKSTAILLLLVSASCNKQEAEVYFFSYFMDNGQDGLHLAYSEDGLHWKVLNGGKSVLTPTVSEDKLMRDPCIIKGKDGKFHMVWTVSWNDKGIGYAYSDNLKDWSAQQFIPVMAHEPKARNCWAPEITYDPATAAYYIYWATTIEGKYEVADSLVEKGYNHRLYYTATKDFQSFTPTALFYDAGFNVIDGTIQASAGGYTMFLKNETPLPTPEKNIRTVTASTITGPWSLPSAPITGDYWAEGPTAIQMGQDWVVYFDKYRKHQMGAVKSSDGVNWEDISDQVVFPEGTRHGTVFKGPKELVEEFQPTGIE